MRTIWKWALSVRLYIVLSKYILILLKELPYWPFHVIPLTMLGRQVSSSAFYSWENRGSKRYNVLTEPRPEVKSFWSLIQSSFFCHDSKKDNGERPHVLRSLLTSGLGEASEKEVKPVQRSPKPCFPSHTAFPPTPGDTLASVGILYIHGQPPFYIISHVIGMLDLFILWGWALIGWNQSNYPIFVATVISSLKVYNYQR